MEMIMMTTEITTLAKESPESARNEAKTRHNPRRRRVQFRPIVDEVEHNHARSLCSHQNSLRKTIA